MTDPTNIIPDSYYDQLYERNESISSNECPTCGGECHTWYSNCCGATIHDSNCTDCGELCIPVKEICDDCKGEGVVYDSQV